MTVAILAQVLTIAELSLRVFLDMPPELRQKHWERHEKAMDFWWGLAVKIEAQLTPEKKP